MKSRGSPIPLWINDSILLSICYQAMARALTAEAQAAAASSEALRLASELDQAREAAEKLQSEFTESRTRSEELWSQLSLVRDEAFKTKQQMTFASEAITVAAQKQVRVRDLESALNTIGLLSPTTLPLRLRTRLLPWPRRRLSYNPSLPP